MLGGAMQRKHLAEYAAYLTKFLEAYAAEGVPVDGITSQNEVDAEQDGRMPACVWPQELEIEFVGRHLGPMLAAKGIRTKIWLIDHNYDLWGRAICELDVPDVNKYAEGVAWHGYSGKPEMMSRVHDAHPEKNMYWTEGGPDVTDPKYLTDWSQWSATFTGILRNWCRSISGWNLALDERGKPNIGPFPCGGVVTIHSKTKEIARSGQYWALAHYSRALRRGARRIDSHGDIEGVSHAAFTNPDGEGVLVLANTRADRTVQLQMAGMVAEAAVPADSVMTLTWS
jgi:glucosylceramidase